MPHEQDLVTIQVRVPKHAADAVRAVLDGMIIPTDQSAGVLVGAFVHVERSGGGPICSIAPCGLGIDRSMTPEQIVDSVIGCAMISASAWHSANGIAELVEKGRPGCGASLMSMFNDVYACGKAEKSFRGNDMSEVFKNAPPGMVRKFLEG
jgi:hypothetical protein